MPRIVFLLIFIISTVGLQAQESETTTYYFIRHAEKNRTDKTNKNPDLTDTGVKRAIHWNKVFEQVDFDLIFSTNYNRTLQTALPTSKQKGLEIQLYNPRELYSDDFRLKTQGKTVLIVGHSNTTPQFVNKVLNDDKYSDIDDLNNSNLYIVIRSNELNQDILLEIDHPD